MASPLAPLQIGSVTQTGPNILRVTMTRVARCSDPGLSEDALDPANWTVTGSDPVSVLSVSAPLGDPKSVDLVVSMPLRSGTWRVSASASIVTVLGEAMDPTPSSFTATTTFPIGVVGGVVSDGPAEDLRKHLNPIFRDPKNWRALLTALSIGDAYNQRNAKLAFDQLYRTSASGTYLTQRAGDYGVPRPHNLGMPDPIFRQYSIKSTANKLTENSVLDLLEVFYGPDSVRARAETDLAEPFSLQDGDNLQVLVDERFPIFAFFSDSDFALTAQAKAVEVAVALTRALKAAGTQAFALPVVDPETGAVRVRLYSGSLGLGSSVRITGGRAQLGLSFPTSLAVFNALPALPTWTITYTALTQTLRFSPSGNFDMSLVRVGDYAAVYGTEFTAGNRGSFPITNVYWTPASSYFEVLNPLGSSQAGLAQVAHADLLLFRPTKQVIGAGAQAAFLGAEVDVVLPATSRAVGRSKYHAAYAQLRPTVTVQSVRRVGQTVTVGAVAHGLSAGNRLQLSGIRAVPTVAAPVVGTPPNLDASVCSLWASTTPLVARVDHTGTQLADGRALLVAGNNGAANVSSVSLVTLTGPTTLGTGEKRYACSYVNDAALPVAGGQEPRNHAATLLQSGKVLVTGGENAALGAQFAATFLYTPGVGTGTWAAGGNMGSVRARHRQVLLQDGRVLVVGGVTGGITISTCEIYNPATNTFSAAASMNFARRSHTLVLLSNGKVLVIGGISPGGDTCEIYDPAGNTWTLTGRMDYARFFAAAVQLPDGHVLVAGGVGGVASWGGGSVVQTTCEIYNPTSGRWRAGPTMTMARNRPHLFLVGTRVYALGDAQNPGADFSECEEYLDLTEFGWRRSTAQLTVGRTVARVVPMLAGTYLLSGGTANDGSGIPAADRVLVLGSESSSSGSLDGEWVVATVPTPDTLTFTTPASGYYSGAGAAMSLTPVGAAPATIPGPYIFDPNAGVGVTGTQTTSTTKLSQGLQYGSVDVAAAATFPDASGWLVFNFGYANQVGPVRYLGRTSGTRLTLDFSYRFPKDVPVGSTVCLLAQRGPFVPADATKVGAFYLTDSPSGRVEAQRALGGTLSAGSGANFKVLYPGDRGLGNEGRPDVSVQKISDEVAVWGGDDPSADVAAARKV